MRGRRYLGTVLVALAVTACGGGGSDQPSITAPPDTTTPAPTATTSSIALASASFLGVRFARPVGWSAKRTSSSAHAGNVTYTAPGRRGTVYVERNDCAACVDQGLVMHGHRNGVPDPNNAVTSYFPTSRHAIDPYRVSFTTAATKPYAAKGRLTVTRSGGQLTGYVVIIVTLPAAESATTATMLDSLRVS